MSARSAAPFSARTVLIVAIVSIVALAAFLLLSAYEGDIRPQRDGGEHALSNSAVGFSGAVQLAQLTGSTVQIVRSAEGHYGRGLLIVTPNVRSDPDEVKRFLERRGDLPTLVVMPKRITTELRDHPGWVREGISIAPESAARLLKGTAEITLYGAGNGLRSVRGPGLEVIVPGLGSGALLARVGNRPLYVLADPDALNNLGLKTLEGAGRARAILDHVEVKGQPILFDTVIAGVGKTRSLLKLAFEPPFLPFTLCLALAAILAALHAARRFGPAAHEERAVAFGKRALAENGAALLRLARRRHRTGGRYAALTREAVATATGAPPGLTGEELDRYLDKLNREGEPFTAMAARAAAAPDTRRLMSAVRDLYRWRRTVTREH